MDAIELGALVAPGADGKPTPFTGEFTIYVSPEQLASALAASAEWTNATDVRLGFSQPTKPMIVNPLGFQYNHWLTPFLNTEANTKTA